MSNVLSAVNLTKTYQKGLTQVCVLKDLDFALKQGETIAIVGESGVGKSTLLHLLGAISEPSFGEVFYRGRPVSCLNETVLAKLRNQEVGFIFQFHYLLPEFDAIENVSMPLLMRREKKCIARKKAVEMLSLLGLEHRLLHRPSELSGGEQQRVAIARAMICEPQVLLADEPTGNLDIDTARNVSFKLFEVVKKSGKSMVLVTHNPELAIKADRVLRLQEGKLFQEK